jgi:hypothetical protein
LHDDVDGFCSGTLVFCFGLSSWFVAVGFNVSFGLTVGDVIGVDFGLIG